MASLPLREHPQIAGNPLELPTPSTAGKPSCDEGNDLGYGKSVEDWAIRSQAPYSRLGMSRGRFRDLTGMGGQQDLLKIKPVPA